MSYARFSEHSNVYVYADVGGYVSCCGCILDYKWDYHTPAEVVAHMREHEQAGHLVPEHLFDESLYPPDDFIAMCDVHLCREQIGHSGGHTPIDPGIWNDAERHEQIRATQIDRSALAPVTEEGDEDAAQG